MNEIIMTIKYDNGQISIREEFFPATQSKFKKLLKLLKNACFWNDYDEELNFLKGFLAEKEDLCVIDTKVYANRFISWDTTVSELERQLRDKKQSNGVPLTKADIKEWKRKLSNAKYERSKYKSNFNECIRKQKGLNANRKTLDEWMRK